MQHLPTPPSSHPGFAPAAAPAATRKADLIEGFITGLSAILAFSDETPRLTPSELAATLGISRAAARRYLITLAHAGYAASDGRQYWLTPRVLALGRSYIGSARLPRTVRPYLQHVTASVQESSNLALLEGGEVVYTASANLPRLMSTMIDPGTRLPAHATAAGRVLLAALPKAEFEVWLAENPLTAYTAHTVTAKRAFIAEVEAARSAGYSAVESQFELGLRGIAVPLTGRDGSVAGALGISMAAAGISMKMAVKHCMPALRAAAADLRELI